MVNLINSLLVGLFIGASISLTVVALGALGIGGTAGF